MQVKDLYLREKKYIAQRFTVNINIIDIYYKLQKDNIDQEFIVMKGRNSKSKIYIYAREIYIKSL